MAAGISGDTGVFIPFVGYPTPGALLVTSPPALTYGTGGNGQLVPFAVDAGGEQINSDIELFRQLLVEFKVLNQQIATLNNTADSEVDSMRRDFGGQPSSDTTPN